MCNVLSHRLLCIWTATPACFEKRILVIDLLMATPFPGHVVQPLFEQYFFFFRSVAAALGMFSSRRIQNPHCLDHSAQLAPCAHLIHGRDHTHDGVDANPAGHEDYPVYICALVPVEREWRVRKVPTDPERHRRVQDFWDGSPEVRGRRVGRRILNRQLDVWISLMMLLRRGGLGWRGDCETAHHVDVGDVEVDVLSWHVSERRLLDRVMCEPVSYQVFRTA